MLTVKASERTVIGKKPITYLVPGGNTRVLSMAEEDAKGWFGIIGSTIVTDWQLMTPDFNDQVWPFAKVQVGNHSVSPWNTIDGIAETAKWIWANNTETTVNKK